MQRIFGLRLSLLGLAFSGLLLGSCSQGEGGRCQITSDCSGGLTCCEGTSGNGTCRSGNLCLAGNDAAVSTSQADAALTTDASPDVAVEAAAHADAAPDVVADSAVGERSAADVGADRAVEDRFVSDAPGLTSVDAPGLTSVDAPGLTAVDAPHVVDVSVMDSQAQASDTTASD